MNPSPKPSRVTLESISAASGPAKATYQAYLASRLTARLNGVLDEPMVKRVVAAAQERGIDPVAFVVAAVEKELASVPTRKRKG